ncbi:baseplate wedge subunit [Pseudomonas phage PspYZU05]|uniref:Baseplate wedge subunit n=1 Tax=Pseudomonas phage PspYZU05 TaxID=1983556 RepID=A0A2U7N2J2_9CAUD|nr:baseplate wedge subunit [Pseudomonas phage PspYZU05]ASD52100.1 baseplate wedge subunit [Pseudomonas phage PspYZU05]
MILDNLYVDLDPKMSMSWDKDIAASKGVRAVKNSMLAIITTRKGSRPFYPDFGCNMSDQLFENMNPLTADTLERNIVSSIRSYEPRVSRLLVRAVPDYDNNSIQVEIRFSIIDNPDIVEQLKLNLRKRAAL